jgi:hypothetical protein
VDGSPNHIAYAMLFAWPLVCIVLFVVLPTELAAISSLLGGYLLLPSIISVDLPLVPPLDKTSVAAVSTLLLCWMKGQQKRPPPQSWTIYALCLAYIVAPIFTSLGNSYELQYAGVSIPGFYPLDAVKIAGRNFIFLAPFFIGSRYLSSSQSRILLLKAVAVAALIYSLPMLFEVRFSPQLNKWVYGYYPRSFETVMRGGGFRPNVFIETGIMAATFVALALIAAIVATRGRWRIWRVPGGAASAYLAALLVVCKSLGAFVYGAIAAPIVMFTRPRTWTKVACALLLLACAYPELRWHGLIPIHHIADAAKSISPARFESFETRVKNEDQLLSKAEEKPAFGWGAWGRNRIYSAVTGQDISLTDGEWVIEFGTWGWLGYLSLFGLFAAAGLRAMRAVGRENTTDNIAIGGLSILLAVNVMDLLPNATLSPVLFLVAGSLARAVPVHVRQQLRQTSKLEHAAEPMLASSSG